MIPIHIMQAAHKAESSLWEVRYSTSNGGLTTCFISRGGIQVATFTSEYAITTQVSFEAMREDASWCAALRAFAEMEPTEAMLTASFEALKMAERYSDWAKVTNSRDISRSYILAAAEEGEDLGRDVLPSSTEAKC